jgi:dolichol-phosphate mannosyltransferase
MGSSELGLSIVIPIKNEAGNIERVSDEIASAMSGQEFDWEVIWVDDGSTDESLAALRRLVEHDARHRYISFKKNAGQSAALLAGFHEARGPLIATMDGDGQNDPADLPALARKVQSGESDMANGYRARRSDGLARKIPSLIGNGFRNLLTGKTVRDVGCSTRVFRKACVRSLPAFRGMHRFLPTLVALQGFTISEFPVNHRPRTAGVTKYSINNRLWVGLFDTFGVLWLRKRAARYQVAVDSGSRQ